MKVAERVSSLALGILWIGHKPHGPHTLSRFSRCTPPLSTQEFGQNAREALRRPLSPQFGESRSDSERLFCLARS